MVCVSLRDFNQEPEVGSLVSVHEAGYDQVVELDLPPVGLPPHLIVDEKGRNLFAVAGSLEAVKGWAILQGFEVMRVQ